MTENHTIIGRKDELAQLQHAITSVEQGQGRIILISGQAGVGKTLLAEECLIGSGLSIFTARATENTSPAYGLIVTLLRDCFRVKPYEFIRIRPSRSLLSVSASRARPFARDFGLCHFNGGNY